MSKQTEHPVSVVDGVERHGYRMVDHSITRGNQFFTIVCPGCKQRFTLLDGADEIPPHDCRLVREGK